MMDNNPNAKLEADLEKVYQSQSNSKTFVSEHFGTLCQLLLNRQSPPTPPLGSLIPE